MIHKPKLDPVIIRDFLVTVMLFISSLSYATDLSQQRWQFDQAQQALQKQDWAQFQTLLAQLKDYPLHYYLHYLYLQPRLKYAQPSEVESFLNQYRDSAYGSRLQEAWLKQLAAEGQWHAFLRTYTPQRSTVLRCYYAQARLHLNQDRKTALADTLKLWLVGKSQPNACDPAFEYLYQSALMDDTLLWKRIRLAMNKGRVSLASALAKRLSPGERYWAQLWQTMHLRPSQTLEQLNDEVDSPQLREIVLHGIKRLARKNFDHAVAYWQQYQRRLSFSAKQIGIMQCKLALASFKQQHPQALSWLTAVNKKYLNEAVNDARLKLALTQRNWRALADFITEINDEDRALRQRYWLGRALEQLGQNAEARKVYESLAKERDYYGFLAADRISLPYEMQHRPIKFTPAEQTQLMKKLSLRAAHEFYQRDEITHARREWAYLVKHLSDHEQTIAAALASRWGWHDRAILTVAKAGHFDDLEVRFPLAFYDALAHGARKQQLDLAWVYGVVRQESAFMNQVSSHAGALGLMQLMPSTGRLVARQLGLPIRSRQDILEINNNVALGTAYLRQMLDKFDGNYMLATAAYNAGPGRARRWAAENQCLPADIWVEMIPFNETRNYVRRVLFYTSIFEHRLGQQQRPLRIALVPQDNCRFQIGYSDNNSSDSEVPG